VDTDVWVTRYRTFAGTNAFTPVMLAGAGGVACAVCAFVPATIRRRWRGLEVGVGRVRTTPVVIWHCPHTARVRDRAARQRW
jgi:hypothetical protein